MAKHRAVRYRTPREWRWRVVKNRWYAFIKPDLKRWQRATQSRIKANVQNFIKKIQ